MIVEVIELPTHPTRSMAQSDVYAITPFAHKLGIAYLEDRVTRMRTVVVQLFERGRAVGVRVICYKSTSLP